MIKKRVLSLILSILMIFTMLPTSIFTVNAAETDNEASTVAIAYAVGDTFESNSNDETKLPTSIPTGSYWKKADEFEKLICDKEPNHQHTLEDCFTTICLHGLNHSATCIPNATTGCGYNGVWGCTQGHSAHYGVGSLLAKTWYGGTCNHKCTADSGCCIPKCFKEENHTHSYENNCYTYTWTLKWNEYTVEWYKKVVNGDETLIKSGKVTHGNSVDVPVITVDEDQNYIWEPVIDNEVTSVIVKPENVEHEGTIKYTAIVSADTYYTVTYMVDGAIYVIEGKEQVFNVNATKNKTVPSVADPSKINYKFNGWTNADKIGKVPTGNVVLEAQWVDDKNNNDKADNDGEIATVTVKVTNGTAKLESGHDKVYVAETDTKGTYVVVWDTKGGNDQVKLTATANNGEATNVAYYLDKELANTDNGKVDTIFSLGSNTEVTLTFSKEEFNLKPLADGEKYEIVINGFNNTLKSDGLKNYVLDAVLGAGIYDPDHYKVEMLANYGILGEAYWNVTGYTAGLISIPASWFVDQLKVDGLTENEFRITKLAASNVSGIDLYHDGVVVIASDSRQSITANDITLDLTDYNKNTLADVTNAIKGNVKVKGNDIDDKYVNITLEPADQALTTEKQYYTATVTIKDNPDYIVGEGVTAIFTITADISTYTVTWVADGKTIENETVAYGGTATKTPAVPEKEGHTGAWNSGVPDKITDNVIITAQYTINQYAITFVDHDGDVIATLTQDYATDVTAPANPVREGYTFDGWEPTVPATMPAKDMTIKATYSINTYYITWVIEGVEETTGYVYDTYVNKENPAAPDGYGFGGWYDEAGNRVTLPFNMHANDDGIRLEAKFFKAAAMIVDNEDNVTLYEAFANALNAAQASDTIVLLDNVLCYGEIAITKSITIDGNGFSFVADENYGSWYTTNKLGIKNYKVYPLAIKSDNVTLFNVTVDCNKLGKGLDILGYKNIVLDNVTVKNEKGNAININGANVILRNKVTSNNIIGGGTNYSIVAENDVVLDVRTVAFQGTPNYSNTDMDRALAIDGTSYWSIKKLDANGDLAGYANSLSGLSNGYGYQLLEDMTAGKDVLLLNAGHKGTLDLNGYTLTVADGKTLTVNGVLNINNADTIVGKVVIGNTAAQIAAPAGWNNIENGTDSYKIIYHNGAYRLGSEITFVYGNGEGNEVITVPVGESFEAPVPTWADHHFTGWDNTVVTTPTEDATYIAQWVDDRNENEIGDGSETITITVTGVGTYVVDGAIDIGDGKYVFNSTNPFITIVATPVVENGISKTYVYSIAGIGSDKLHYGDGFIATETVKAANGDEITIKFKAVPVIKTESDVVVDYNFYTQEIPYEDICNAVIAEPEIMVAPETKVEYTYFARGEMTHTVSIESLDLDPSVKTILDTLGITEFSFDIAEYGDAAYNQVESGDEQAMTVTKTIEITLLGSNSFESGKKVCSMLTVLSETGFRFTKISNTTGYDVYVY